MTYLVFLTSDTPLPLHFAVCTLNHFRKFQALKHNSWAFFSLHSGCELITNATPPHLSDSFGHILIRRGRVGEYTVMASIGTIRCVNRCFTGCEILQTE